jgi:hypothetical protein
MNTTTAELAGRGLDRAVTEAMGWKRDRVGHGMRYHLIPDAEVKRHFTEPVTSDMLPSASNCVPLPRYSAADFSGFAPVVEWLTANAPGGACPEFIGYSNGGGARFAYYPEDVGDLTTRGASIPEAACRLVVAWDRVRKERGWA